MAVAPRPLNAVSKRKSLQVRVSPGLLKSPNEYAQRIPDLGSRAASLPQQRHAGRQMLASFPKRGMTMLEKPLLVDILDQV